MIKRLTLLHRPVQHLIPRSEHTLLVKRQVFSLVEMRSRIAYLCRPCHSAVHAFIPDHAEMAKDWNTVDRLLEHEGVRKWALYASKQVRCALPAFIHQHQG